jgi:hypothetical protein
MPSYSDSQDAPDHPDLHQQRGLELPTHPGPDLVTIRFVGHRTDRLVMTTRLLLGYHSHE